MQIEQTRWGQSTSWIPMHPNKLGVKALLALLISCIGRKLVLKQCIEEEEEGIQDVLAQKTALAGFYSYGKISTFNLSAKCELHNQTMTVTTLSEF